MAPNPAARLLALDAAAGRTLWLAIGAGVGAAVAWVGIALAMSVAIAGTVQQTLRAADTGPLLTALTALVVVRGLLFGAGEWLAARAAIRVVARTRESLTAHLAALGPAYLAGERSGEVASTLVDGLEAVETWVRSYRPARALADLVPLLVLVVVLVIDPLSALVLVVTGPVLVFLLALIGAKVAPASAARAAELRWMQGYFADMLRGLATLRAFGRSREQADRIREIGRRYGDATMAVLRTAFQASLVLEWGAAVAMALIAVELSLRLMTGEIRFQPTLAILIVAPEFFLPLRRLATHYHEGAAGREAAARVVDILDTPVQAPGSPAIAALPAGPLGDLVLVGVTLTYPGRPEPALRGVDLVLRAGCRTVIVGPSGAGKSTLVALLLRFVGPAAGRITVGGVDLATVNPAEWRARIAYVPQAPHLFHGTVAANLRLARPEASDEELAAAAEAAGATAFIEDLPAGFETPIGEEGVRLSGGQRQRLAIARALLRDAELVVLDEPTAHLDPEAEASVADAIDRLAAGRTVIVVSHRPVLAAHADVVVQLDRGRIVR